PLRDERVGHVLIARRRSRFGTNRTEDQDARRCRRCDDAGNSRQLGTERGERDRREGGGADQVAGIEDPSSEGPGEHLEREWHEQEERAQPAAIGRPRQQGCAQEYEAEEGDRYGLTYGRVARQ